MPNYSNMKEAAEKLELPEGFVPFGGFPDGDSYFDVIYSDGTTAEAEHHDDIPWENVIAFKELPEPDEDDYSEDDERDC